MSAGLGSGCGEMKKEHDNENAFFSLFLLVLAKTILPTAVFLLLSQPPRFEPVLSYVGFRDCVLGRAVFFCYFYIFLCLDIYGK